MIFGPDVSRYQGAVDHAQVRREGHRFLIAKISQGAGLRDPQWPRNRDGARAAGLITAGYHYITTDNPDAQARNCAAWIGDRNVPVALDHERGGGNISQFRAVLEAFRRAGLKVTLSYIPPFYWREIGQPSLAGLPPLWKARYASTASGTPAGLYAKVPANYWDAYGGQSPVLLQYSDAALIAGQKMDANAFRGTVEEFAALVGGAGGGGVTPPPIEEGLFMALPDAEQVELRDKIRNLYFQLVTGDGQGGPGGWGWETFAGGTTAGGHPERLTPVDYWRRNNVRVEDLARQVGALRAEVASLAAALHGIGDGGLDPQAVADVLRQAVIAAGFELHGTLTPGSGLRGAHEAAGEPH